MALLKKKINIMHKHYVCRAPIIVAGRKVCLDNQLIGYFENNSVI